MPEFAKSRRVAVAVGIVLPGVFGAIVEPLLEDVLQVTLPAGTLPIVSAIVGGLIAYMLWEFFDRRSKNSSAIAIPVVVQSQSTDSRPNLQLAGKTLSPRTPAELVGEVKGLTTIAAEREAGRHLGNWLQTTIAVWDVRERQFFKQMRVSGDNVADGTSIHLYFESKLWKVALETLNRGDQISAVGKIDRITDSSVSLQECELLA